MDAVPYRSAPVVIVGAGLAGWTTARELRKLDAQRPLVMITADSGDFYAKPSLSNAFAQGRTPQELVTTPAARMAESLGVTLVPHTRVLGLDTAERRLHTATGDWTYGQLVLATGAQPIRVQVQGEGASQVMSVNSLDDFSRLYPLLTKDVRSQNRSVSVVVMGAGLIGCEFANDLAGAGMQVQVVDPGTCALAALLPEAASQELQDALSALGVRWHFGTTVSAVHHRAGHLVIDSGATTSTPAASPFEIELSNGQRLAADVVLSAVGLRPDIALAQAAGLKCDRGIQVNGHLQTSAPNVYAIGDNAQYASAGDRALPYVMPIMQAARALAATLAGQASELTFGLMPVTVKTPACPLVIAPPVPGTAGQWHKVSPGIWQFQSGDGQPRGFVLSGAQTKLRAEQSRALAFA